MVIVKNKVRNIFKMRNIQLSEETLELINREVGHLIIDMAENANDNGVKRVTPDNFHYAIKSFAQIIAEKISK